MGKLLWLVGFVWGLAVCGQAADRFDQVDLD